LRGKCRGRKRVRRTKHPCELGWRVRWTKEFRHHFARRGVWREVRKFLKDLEHKLNSDEGREVLRRLLGSEVITRVEGAKFRRLRKYFSGVYYRLFYVVYTDLCRVWFTHAEKRDEETYKRFRRRFGKK